MPMRTLYPFTAIVGQARLKKALVLNAINPALGGVLVRGHKGTAKSTAARGLAGLLPEIEVVEGCAFHCHPTAPIGACAACSNAGRDDHGRRVVRRPMAFVDLPLGATEDRLIGTLNLEDAIQQGRRRFEPGLLAEAHRGILYVDEVNLLEDHLVDVLLDAAAMGTNVVEREGVSVAHPSRFILIGTMNPEEGELRPQFLDRFALCVDVEGIDAPAERAEVIRRRLRFEADPEGFRDAWDEAERALAGEIARAQASLPEVTCPDSLLERVACLTVELGVHGHRADLALVKTACTLAADHGRTEVAPDDIREAAELVLPHRMRRTPFQEPQLASDELERSFDRHFNPPTPPPPQSAPPSDIDRGDEPPSPDGETPHRPDAGKKKATSLPLRH
jgi:magnesium chelatase subunit D